MSITLTFLGAAETVTGSRYLIESDRARVLVDCGLFQGYKKLRQRNWAALPFLASSLDAVVLTHAHIDHSGYLPKLCKMGFTGKVYCTQGTSDLLKILLPDSGYLQEEDARRANKYGYTRHHPAEPLYTREDAQRCLRRLAPRPYHEPVEVASDVVVTFSRAGHIIGSACLDVRIDNLTVAFTGDVGRPIDPIMKAADPLGPADYLVTESTYGNRRHPEEEVTSELERIVNETTAREGAIVVPAFAVGRAQHLLHVVAQLKADRRIPDVPAFLDSPMAINATGLFCDHTQDHRLSEAECHSMCDAAQYTRTPEESKAIDRRTGPMIVISASGMLSGGRILHHLRRFLPEAGNTVLLVGYQATGTRGRALVEGIDELKLHGQYVPVRARVVQVHGLSAHADSKELLGWLSAGRMAPRRVFVTHGEPSAADAFRRQLCDGGWNAVVPEDGSQWVLNGE